MCNLATNKDQLIGTGTGTWEHPHLNLEPVGFTGTIGSDLGKEASTSAPFSELHLFIGNRIQSQTKLYVATTGEKENLSIDC
jgi:hypothetical protein